MGLIITNEIYTNAGVTSELYININRIDITKNAMVFCAINLYLNKSVREENDADFLNTSLVSSTLHSNYVEL